MARRCPLSVQFRQRCSRSCVPLQLPWLIGFLVVVGPVGVAEPTTVINFAGGDAVVARVGAGDISLFD